MGLKDLDARRASDIFGGCARLCSWRFVVIMKATCGRMQMPVAI